MLTGDQEPNRRGLERLLVGRHLQSASFCVAKADVVAQSYDLSINRYKEVVHEEMNHRAPKEILADLARLETEIQQGMRDPGGC